MWWILQMSNTILKTCPTKNQCYCGQQYPSSEEFKTHEKQHAGQVWACFECDKKSKVMTNMLCTSTTRPSMKGCTCICTYDMCSVDGHPYGNDEQYTVWWHMQEDHGLWSPWVVLNVMAPSAKKTNMAPNRHPMLRKSYNVTNVQRNTPQRLHYSSIRRCTKALTRSICAASVVKVSVQPQPCTDLKRYMKITEHIKKSKPNSKFQI